MIRLFANANYDFIAYRKWAYGITAALLLIGVVFLVARGINYSIEFTGGTLVQVRAHRAVTSHELRVALDQGGLPGAEIASFGSDSQYVIRARVAGGDSLSGETQTVATLATRALDGALGAGQYTIERVENVGPKVGRELQGKALLAILMSFVVTLIYLAIRFEWRFGLAAVLATAHDILATVAFIAIMDIEVSLVVVGAVLTVVGYSLNDTIIIFDRVRENLKKYRRQNLYEILNLSINETLPRSILTHATTLAATVALLVFAGEVIRPFAWVMSFGIFTGTFSSIYIAAPVLLLIEQRWPGQDARGVRAFTGRGPSVSGPGAPPAVSAVPATPAPAREPRKPQPAR